MGNIKKRGMRETAGTRRSEKRPKNRQRERPSLEEPAQP